MHDPSEPLLLISTNDLTPFFNLVLAITSSASAVATALIALWMRRLEKNTNSKMDAVLALTAALSRASGNVEGRSELTHELENSTSLRTRLEQPSENVANAVRR